MFSLPNQLTIARLFLAVLLFLFIAWESWLWSLLVFIAAAITDWLDGVTARWQGTASALGRNLDPLVDKVLIGGAFIFLLPVRGAGLVPWMVTVVVARELIITGLRSFIEQHGGNFGADWLGKIKMVLQCAALIAIFAALYGRASGWQGFGQDVLIGLQFTLIYAMIVATAVSGLQYLWRAAWLLRGGSA
ncbi:MAG: CDP-diacylglycerol--glycerol-3-phosphate 3-phosphatidyltransferase [Gemmataceae bacterium]